MKPLPTMRLAAAALAFAGSEQAADRHTSPRPAAVNHQPVHGHAARCDCARGRTRYAERAYSDEAAPVRGPFYIEESDGRAAPTINSDYWSQESIYDFQDGKRANIKEYRY